MIALRPTTPGDLDFVLALEHHPDNRDFIGQWRRDEHLATLDRADRQHLVIAGAAGALLGYIITYDVRRDGFGVYVKRIAVSDRARGIGREALTLLAARAWQEGTPLVCLAVRPYNTRAQRCYRAVGFEDWPLSASGWSAFLSHVDPDAPDCVIMRLLQR